MRPLVLKAGAQLVSGEVPAGYRQVLLVLGPENPPGSGFNQYHWYRQDSDGSWSHKDGYMPLVVGVADPIADAAARGYPTSGGYFLVPTSGLDVDRKP